MTPCPRHTRAPEFSALLALCLCALMAAGPAYGDMLGGDLPLLTGIFSTVTDSLAQASQTLAVLKKGYQDAARVAGYADEAAQAFQSFQNYNSGLFAQDVVRGLQSAYPDVGYFQRVASGAGPWAQGSGELQRLITLCLGGPAGSCAPYQQAVSYSDTRQALAATFGAAPAGAYDLAAIDHESAGALAAGSAQVGRSQAASQRAAALLKQCDSTGGSSLAGCQAAGATAQIEQVSVSADIANQVAEGNRLSAMQLELSAEARKRELHEADERRQVLLQGAELSGQRAPSLSADGVDVLTGSGQ